MTHPQPYHGKTALVTGAAKGLGRALCLQLLAQGARVYALDVDEKGLAALQKQSPGLPLYPLKVDISQRQVLAEAFSQIVSDSASLDYVFNNAGIVAGGQSQHMNWAQWERIMGINLWGVIVGSQLAYQQMLKQGSGHIINTASLAGIVPVPESAAYTATKHGVVGLSLALAQEAEAQGIRVSVLIPGALKTNIYTSAINLGAYDYAGKMAKGLVRPLSPDRAARQVLKQLTRGKRQIVVPRSLGLLIGLYRLFPRLTQRLMARAMKT